MGGRLGYVPSHEACGSVTGPVALAAGQRVDAHSHWRHYPRPGSHPPWQLSSQKPSPFEDPVAEGTAPAGCLCTLLPSGGGGVAGVLHHKAHRCSCDPGSDSPPGCSHSCTALPSKQPRLTAHHLRRLGSHSSLGGSVL